MDYGFLYDDETQMIYCFFQVHRIVDLYVVFQSSVKYTRNCLSKLAGVPGSDSAGHRRGGGHAREPGTSIAADQRVPTGISRRQGLHQNQVSSMIRFSDRPREEFCKGNARSYNRHRG